MNLKKTLLWVSVLVVGLLILSGGWSLSQGEENTLGYKIDQVLQNQGKILQQLADIKSELEIVKVRATRR